MAPFTIGLLPCPGAMGLSITPSCWTFSPHDGNKKHGHMGHMDVVQSSPIFTEVHPYIRRFKMDVSLLHTWWLSGFCQRHESLSLNKSDV